jgi:CRP/FNR family cyclic AMP-dependent transcriptional regulator
MSTLGWRRYVRLLDVMYRSAARSGCHLLKEKPKSLDPKTLLAKTSQEALAEMIGTTRSRVSFFMNKFRKLGFIEYNGRIEVHKSLLNLVLHEHPQINT